MNPVAGSRTGVEPREPHRGLLRSLLFVPGDSERKQAKALASPADALILDLEDSVAEAQLPAARVRVRELLVSAGSAAASSGGGPSGFLRPQLWVRVHSLTSGQLLEDLAFQVPELAQAGK